MVAFREGGESIDTGGVGDGGKDCTRGYLVVRLGEEGFFGDLCWIGQGAVA